MRRGQVMGPHFKIKNPLRKFGMGEARNFKHGRPIRIDLGKLHLTNDKISANAAWTGPGTEFCKFWDRLHMNWIR